MTSPRGSADGPHRGWWRASRFEAWRIVSEAEDWRQAWLCLLDARGPVKEPSEVLVLPFGQVPDGDVTGGNAVTETLRETIKSITADLASLDALLKKAKRPLPDLDAATALVAPVKLRDQASKVIDKLGPVAEQAAQAQLFDELPNVQETPLKRAER